MPSLPHSEDRYTESWDIEGTAPPGTVITDRLDLSEMYIDADVKFELSKLVLKGGIKATKATIAAASLDFEVGFCRSCTGRVGRKVQQETPPQLSTPCTAQCAETVWWVRGSVARGPWVVVVMVVCVCVGGVQRGPTSIASLALATSGAGVPHSLCVAACVCAPHSLCVRVCARAPVPVLYGLRARVCRPATAGNNVRGRSGFCGRLQGVPRVVPGWQCAGAGVARICVHARVVRVASLLALRKCGRATRTGVCGQGRSRDGIHWHRCGCLVPVHRW